MRKELITPTPRDAVRREINRTRVSNRILDVSPDHWVAAVAVHVSKEAVDSGGWDQQEPALITQLLEHPLIDKIDVLFDIEIPESGFLNENEQYDLFSESIVRISEKPEEV